MLNQKSGNQNRSNQNWFSAMVEFGNTINAVMRNFGVTHAIAKEIQRTAAMRQSQAECTAIAKASKELINQVGF